MSGRPYTHLLSGLWVLWLWQVAPVAGTSSKLWQVPVAIFDSSSNHSEGVHWEPQCQQRHLQVIITAHTPPRLEGTWVSTRCEVRPGPEFLTRSYTFHPSRQFRALQHYYTDSGCESPSYSLVVRGKLRLRQASWITRGATETEHHLSKVGMVVHSPVAMQRLASRLPPACLGMALGHMVPSRLYELYNARAGRTCLGALGFSMMELGLVRVETQYPQHLQHHGGKVQELYLGDVHTDWAQRAHYSPTGYQTPLQNAMHHIHPCPVCALVFRSTEQRPPVLPHVTASPLTLAGHWVSQRCEARPAVLFLTRDVTFDPAERSWEGVYRHYSDPACSQPTFILRASGHYSQGHPSVKVQGAQEMVFKVTRVLVTALDESTGKVLNGSRRASCGRAGGWELGVEQDVTPTDGCSALGIQLPHKEYELFKIELDHRRDPLLLVGERPSDGSSPDRPQKRPTSFQAPLMHCGGEEAMTSHGDSGSNFMRFQQTSSGARRQAQLSGLMVMVSTLLAWRCWF
ncbi:protein APCDD1-like [Aplochiton taeniatus]